jgi:hypothetical protein
MRNYGGSQCDNNFCNSFAMANVGLWPIGAVPLDPVDTVGIEGPTDKMRFRRAMVDRRLGVAGHEANGDTAITRRKGEITRDDLSPAML